MAPDPKFLSTVAFIARQYPALPSTAHAYWATTLLKRGAIDVADNGVPFVLDADKAGGLASVVQTIATYGAAPATPPTLSNDPATRTIQQLQALGFSGFIDGGDANGSDDSFSVEDVHAHAAHRAAQPQINRDAVDAFIAGDRS